MKKLTLIITLTLLSIAAFAQNRRAAVTQSELMDLVSDYRSNPEFEVVQFGGIAMSAVKTIVLTAMAGDPDPDVRAARKLIRGIRRIAIVDYSDCGTNVKDRFNRKLDRILRNTDPLMEFKDEGERMTIYGVVSDKGDKLQNFILCNPEDGTLICLFGTIDIDTIARFATDNL